MTLLRPRLLTALLLPLVLGATAATPAYADATSSHVLDGAALPLVGATSTALTAQAVAADGSVLDAGSDVLSVAMVGGTATAEAGIVPELGALEGVDVATTQLVLRFTAVTAPDGGAATAALSDGTAWAASIADQDAAVTVSATQATTVAWTFSAPGDYLLRFSAELLGADGTLVDLGAVASVESTIRVTGEPGTSASGTAASAAGADAADAAADVGSTEQDAETAAQETTTDGAADPAAEEGVGSTATVTAADAPVVLSTGNIAVTAKVDQTTADVANKNFTSFDLGLLDKTTNTADGQQWYAADAVVLQIDDEHADAGTGLWSTPATLDDAGAYIAAGGLVLGKDQGLYTEPFSGTSYSNAKTGINSAVSATIRSTPKAPDVLTALSGPGRLQTFDASGTLWDSTWLGTGTAQGEMTAAAGSNGQYATVTDQYYGWSFDAAGTYCVTLEETLQTAGSRQDVTARATYTVVVGDLPADLTLCEQVGADDDGEETTAVTVLDNGHTDVRAWPTQDGTGLDVGVYKSGFIDSQDVVLTGLYESEVPAATDDTDLTFIGDVGSTYWYWSEGSGDATHLWPGFSTENFYDSTMPNGDGTQIATRGVSFTLAGVSGPDGGDVILFSSVASTTGSLYSKSASGVYFDSRSAPMTYTFTANSHTHMNWAFTAQGRYCLSMTAATELASGSWVYGSGQLTVWVGDPAEAASVTPCDQDTTAATATASAITDVQTDQQLVGANSTATFVPLLDDGSLQVVTAVQAGTTATQEYVEPESLILSTDREVRSSSGYWAGTNTNQTPTLTVRTDRLPWGTLDGGVGLTLLGVEGPGQAQLARGSTEVLLDSSDLTLTSTVPSSTRDDAAWRFAETGVYCVAVRWSTTAAGGAASTVDQLLTFVVGSDDPSSADYIDRSTLTTCADGQQAGSPAELRDDGSDDGGSDGDGSEDDQDLWDVPNGSTTASGATILNDGHVDIASQLDGDTLVTTVKDTTTSNVATYRDTDDVVLQLLPGTQTSVPASSTYAFLGDAGDEVWVVAQTQQEGLLWPGWSTEEIATEATQTGVTWSLDGMSGPGEFALYTTGLATVDVLYSTRDGITSADSFEIAQNAHVHGSWAFSAQGTYCLAFTRSTTLASGADVSDEFVLAVAVGEVDVRSVDPSACAVSTDDPDGDGSVDPDDPSTDDGSDDGSQQGGGSDGGSGAGQVCTSATTVVSSGHLDYSAQLVDGRLQSLVGDGSSGTTVYREPSQTVLWLAADSKVTLPAGFEQVGAAGASVYLVPQTQDADLIWLGWSTERLSSADVSGAVTWDLTQVEGPGDVTVFLQGDFGGVQRVVFDGTGSTTVSTGVHAHANWAFTEQGVYRLHMTQTVTLLDGSTSSDSEVLTIVVGDVDPATAVTGGTDCVTQDGSAGTVVAGTDSTTGATTAADGLSAAAAQCTASTATVVSSGHVDWNAQIVDGALQSLIGDDSTGTRVYRDPGSTVLWLKPAGAVVLPSGFAQIGSAGSTVWQVPQTQDADLVWLGWSTELLNAGNASGTVTWSLTQVEGPGTVKVYTTGSFGGIEDLVFSSTGSTSVRLGVHSHANWAFSAQGVYRLHFTQSVTLADGSRSSDSEVLTIAVGDVDPTTALASGTGCGVLASTALDADDALDAALAAAAQARAAAAGSAAGTLADGSGGGTSTAADALAALADARLVPVLLGVLGGLLLVGAAGTGVLWWRRRSGAGAVPAS
ncbi:MAG TPA: TIGR03773 family transporter-associated surface protein [Cellulomonas sp.]